MAPATSFASDSPAHPRGLPVSLPLVALVVMAVLLTFLAAASIDLISSARAYVGGESAWSKGQKGAALSLVQYVQTRDPVHWQQYRRHMAVPLGDRQARLALEQDPPDLAAARQGFIQGANHVDDVDGMVRLFRWFRQVPFMDRAITIWAQGDEQIAVMQAEAQALHAAVQRGATDAELATLGQRLLALEEKFVPLQQRFSATLGDAARTTRTLLTALMAASALLLTLVSVAALRHTARQRLRQQQALRDSEDRRARTLKGSSDGFWEWDLLSGSAYFSPRFEELLGYAPGTLGPLVAQVQALHHPEDLAPARAALQRHLHQGEPYDVELRMQHRSGGWRWLRSRAQADRGHDGRQLLLSGSISDVTERRQAEWALSRREAMFRSLWETTTDAVLIIDTQHVIQFANPSAHRTFGHGPGSLQQQPLSLLQPPHMHKAHVAGAERYMHSGVRRLDWRAAEVVGRHADGHDIPMEICFSELELDGQRHFVGFLRDITRRKQAERALQEANEQLEQRVVERTRELTSANERLRELDRLKSEFLATMSHELRTPLNAILGFTGLMQRGLTGPMNPEQLRQIGHVHDAGRHLLALINDVLDLSRIESGRMEVAAEPFGLESVAADVLDQLRPLAQAKGLAVHGDIEAGLALVGDRRKLVQVLLNLVGNAVKFTHQGQVQVTARAQGAQLVVQVQDSGVGMAPDQLGLLFQAFQQLDGTLGRSHEGTGLGLHLCRKLLALMGGEVSVLSTPGVGSTFTFWLPMSQVAAPRPGTDAAPAATAAESLP